MDNKRVARELLKVAKELKAHSYKNKIVLEITLTVDDDRAPSNVDATYYAQSQLLDKIPERLGEGVILWDARIVKGLVDKEGVFKN